MPLMDITFGQEKAGVLFGRSRNISLALLLETILEPGKFYRKMSIAVQINLVLQ
jgi:hypothetical protein